MLEENKSWLDIETKIAKAQLNFSGNVDLAEVNRSLNLKLEFKGLYLDEITPESLGKMIMYAAGLEAKAIICVGQEITAEIRQSLDWLNMVSRDDVNFYATELELWRIDDSVPAPNFNVVCQPNMWARQLKAGQEPEQVESKNDSVPQDNPEPKPQKYEK